ncbi:MAG: hypothetical protein ACI4JM_09280 [Oscillospiraceae bacterium]
MNRKKLSAIILSLVMSMSVCIPYNIYAETSTTTSYTDESGNTVYVTEDGFEYIIENDEITIIKYTGDAVDLTIPDYIDGLPVTVLKGLTPNGILEKDCTETVTVPSTVKTLWRTFQNSKTLKNVRTCSHRRFKSK